MTPGNECAVKNGWGAEAEANGLAPDAKALAAAEAAVQALQANYPEWVKVDIAKMERALARARSDGANAASHLKALFGICHNVNGQGGSFGYDLVTQIGQSLCDFLRRGDRVTGPSLKVVEAHLVAMRTVIENRIAGDGGRLGRRVVGRLEAMSAEVPGP